MKIKDQFPYKIIEIEHETITLSDGCKLAYRMWLPESPYAIPNPITFAAILEYLPYGKRDGTAIRDQLTHPYFAGYGYACIRVDMRGSGESDGLMMDEYLQREQDDAIEIIRWITKQPWSSGKVGMMGISWGGFNSLQVAAQIETHLPDTLKAIISLCSTDNRFTDDIHYKGGCLLLENAGWASTMLSYCSTVPDPLLVGESWREMWLQRLKHMPLLLKNWLEHQTFDKYWQHGSVCMDYSKIKAAVYLIGGWGDAYKNAVPRMLENLPGPKKGLIGPWAHKYPHFAVPEPAIGFLQEALRWWDFWLKEKPNGVMDEPRMTIYVQESVLPQASYSERPGVWIREIDWPSQHVHPTTFPLNDKGTKLAFHQSPLSNNLAFLQSPLTTGSSCGEYCVIWLGPEFPIDQRYDDAASLSVNSLPLESSLVIVGAAVLKFRIRSYNKHAQLAVRLNDIAPCGASTRFTYGVINLNSPHYLSAVRELSIGEWFDVDIKLDDVGYIVPVGHQLRVSISSAYFPLIWPSKEHAKLEIDLNKSIITLPLHDLQTVVKTPFEEPEAAAPLLLRYDRQPTNTRQVITDAMTGRVTTHIRDDFGRFCFESHGLIIEELCEEKYSILPKDPFSASSEQNWTYKAQRGAWNVETRCSMQLTGGKEKFIIKAEQSAWENDKQVHHHTWEEDVARTAV